MRCTTLVTLIYFTLVDILTSILFYSSTQILASYLLLKQKEESTKMLVKTLMFIDTVAAASAQSTFIK